MEISLDPTCDMGYITFGRSYPGCVKQMIKLHTMGPEEFRVLKQALETMRVDVNVDIAQDGTIHGLEFFDASKFYFQEGEQKIRLRNEETNETVEVDFPL